MKKNFFLIINCLFSFCLLKQSIFLKADIDVTSYYDKKHGHFITKGRLKLDIPHSIISNIALDFKKYRLWVLNDINDEKGKKHDFLTRLRDINVYDKADRGKIKAEILYDLDLIFPFGKKGEKIIFILDNITIMNSLLRSYEIKIAESNFAMNSLNVKLDLKPISQKESEITFYCVVEMSSILNLFLSLKKYKKNIEWRLVKVIKNLGEYALEGKK